MVISTETYGAVYEQYVDALAWMRTLGIDSNCGRMAHYTRVISYWKDAYKIAPSEEVSRAYPDFVNSMIEAVEFIKVYRAFHKVPVRDLDEIRKKLHKASKGPIDMAEEKDTSTGARNYLFEALVAANSHRPGHGITAILQAKSDTGVLLDRQRIWVECKRVTSQAKIETRCAYASKQLDNIFLKQIGSGHRGMVALDISKLFNKGDQIFISRSRNDLERQMEYMIKQFIDEYSDEWQNVYRRRNRKVIGTIIKLSLVARLEDRNILVSADQWALNPRVGVNDADMRLQQSFVTHLEDAP